MKFLVPLFFLVASTTAYTCKHPLYYDGCALDIDFNRTADVNNTRGCGDFAGFQLVCDVRGKRTGQCLCPENNLDCQRAITQQDISAKPNALPQFGSNCQNVGCYGHGQKCNLGGSWLDCETCQEDVKCVFNQMDHFYQCHTCSSCLAERGRFDCSALCGPILPSNPNSEPIIPYTQPSNPEYLPVNPCPEIDIPTPCPETTTPCPEYPTTPCPEYPTTPCPEYITPSPEYSTPCPDFDIPLPEYTTPCPEVYPNPSNC